VINRSADRGAMLPQANVASRGVRAATDGAIVAQDSADESADGSEFRGEGFLRDMADQSARAHTFDRRMRWFWLRRSLRGTTPPPEDVVDLRSHLAPLSGEPAAAPVAPVAPAVPREPIVQVPRQRG
jgi:hypothetical protein